MRFHALQLSSYGRTEAIIRVLEWHVNAVSDALWLARLLSVATSLLSAEPVDMKWCSRAACVSVCGR